MAASSTTPPPPWASTPTWPWCPVRRQDPCRSCDPRRLRRLPPRGLCSTGSASSAPGAPRLRWIAFGRSMSRTRIPKHPVHQPIQPHRAPRCTMRFGTFCRCCGHGDATSDCGRGPAREHKNEGRIEERHSFGLWWICFKWQFDETRSNGNGKCWHSATGAKTNCKSWLAQWPGGRRPPSARLTISPGPLPRAF